MFEIKGILDFYPANVSKKHELQSSWKKVAIIRFDGDTHLYYEWLLERRFGLSFNAPLRGTHLTVINGIVDERLYSECSARFHGKEMAALYDPTRIMSNEKGHWWIDAECEGAVEIRKSIGLDPVPYFGMHITIGRINPKHLEHSKYIRRQILNFGL